MDVRTGVTSVDLGAIVQAATDYIESWLDGDAERMRRCLHPKLVKRSVERDPTTGEGDLDELGAEWMVEATRNGRGKRHAREHEVMVLDAFRDIASVKVASVPYVDYLHVARFGEQWLIVNVLWEWRQGQA